MYCQKCGAENPNDANICVNCSWVLTSTAAPTSIDAKTSACAKASLILGILSAFTCFVTALPAVICGIVGLVNISRSKGQLKGTGLAVTGMALPAIMVPFIGMAMLMPALSKVKTMAQSIVCGTNLKVLGTAITVYTNDYETLPTPELWCDLLITEMDVSPITLTCPDSDAIEGESSYAMNENLIGKDLGDIDPDVVLLFETNKGWTETGRDESIQNRFFYKYFKEGPYKFSYCDPYNVFKDRFNQVGGPNILTTENHYDAGCNVLFVDGYAEFIPAEDISRLKWQ